MLKRKENIDIDLLVSKILDGEASVEESIQVYELMDQPDSEELIESFRSQYQVKYLLEKDKNSKILDTKKAYSKFEAFISEQGGNRNKVKPLTWFYRIAAVMIILVGIGFLILKYTPAPKLISACSEHNSNMSVDLPDGSRITLNKNSKIIYPERFKKNTTRAIEFEGEGFFEVESSPDKQFIVTVGDIDIVALGTEFNIYAYPEKETVIVTVQEGHVRMIKYSRLEDEEKVIELQSGETGKFYQKDSIFTKNPIKDSNYLAWKTGIITFANTKLEQVAHVLEKEYDVKMVFENEELKNCEFTGKFKDHTFEQVIEVLELAFEITIDIKDNSFFISGEGC